MSASATTAPANSTEFGNNLYAVLASQTGSSESAESAKIRTKILETLLSFEISFEEIKSIRKKFPSDNEIRHTPQNILVQADKIVSSVKSCLTRPELTDATYEAIEKNSGDLDVLLVRIKAIHSTFMSMQKSSKKATAEASSPAIKASVPVTKASVPVTKASVKLSVKQESLAEALDEQFSTSEYIKGEHLHTIVSAAQKLGLVMDGLRAPKFLEGKKILASRKVDPSKPNKEYILADNWLAIVADLTFEDDASASPEASIEVPTWVSKASAETPVKASVEVPVKDSTKAPGKIYFEDVYALDELFAKSDLVESLIVSLVKKNQKYFKEPAFLKLAIDLFQCGFYKENTPGSTMWERLLAEGFIKVNPFEKDGKSITFFDRPTYVLTQKALDMAPTKPLSVPVRPNFNRQFPALSEPTNTTKVNISTIGVSKAFAGGSSTSQSGSAKMGSPSENESRQLQSLDASVSKSFEALQLELKIAKIELQLVQCGGR
jgi:hypothetical protein